MIKIIQIALICTFIPVTVLSFELTQNHIQQAEMTRTMGVRMGLNKATPEQMVDAAMDMATHSETEPRELTKAEKKAMSCMMAKVLDMQFKSDIKEYARFLNDETYRVEINKRWEEKCKVHYSAQ